MDHTEMSIEYSSHRSSKQAWCVSSHGRKTYAHTREEALDRHAKLLSAIENISQALKLCAAQSLQANFK